MRGTAAVHYTKRYRAKLIDSNEGKRLPGSVSDGNSLMSGRLAVFDGRPIETRLGSPD